MVTTATQAQCTNGTGIRFTQTLMWCDRDARSPPSTSLPLAVCGPHLQHGSGVALAPQRRDAGDEPHIRVDINGVGDVHRDDPGQKEPEPLPEGVVSAVVPKCNRGLDDLPHRSNHLVLRCEMRARGKERGRRETHGRVTACERRITAVRDNRQQTTDKTRQAWWSGDRPLVREG